MENQTVKFAVVYQNGHINNIGRSAILCPEIKFKGGSVPWYEDKLKSDRNAEAV